MKTKTYHSNDLFTLSFAAVLIIIASFTTTVFAAPTPSGECPEQIVQSSTKIGSDNLLYGWIQAQNPAGLENAYKACKNKSEELFKSWAELHKDISSRKRQQLSQEHTGYYNFLMNVGTEIGKVGTGHPGSPRCVVSAIVGLSTAIVRHGKSDFVGGPVEYRVSIDNERAGDFFGNLIESSDLQNILAEMKSKNLDCIFSF